MKILISVTKTHFNNYKSIYKVFVLSSIIYLFLSFILFSRTQDFPFDIILAMIYEIFGLPILGIFMIRKSMYLDDDFMFLNKKEILAFLIYPVIVTNTIFLLYSVIRLPEEVFSITGSSDLVFPLTFGLFGFLMYSFMTHMSLAFKDFESDRKQFIWKISIHLLYLFVFFGMNSFVNINYKDMFLIISLIIYTTHISVDILLNY